MYFLMMGDLARQKVDEQLRAADAHRLATAAAPGVPRPGAWRPWLGHRLVSLGERLAETAN
jgi:hypothetical protein